jgi:hypothetical protein
LTAKRTAAIFLMGGFFFAIVSISECMLLRHWHCGETAEGLQCFFAERVRRSEKLFQKPYAAALILSVG